MIGAGFLAHDDEDLHSLGFAGDGLNGVDASAVPSAAPTGANATVPPYPS